MHKFAESSFIEAQRSSFPSVAAVTADRGANREEDVDADFRSRCLLGGVGSDWDGERDG
jgi:hypothetical protein